MNKNLPVFGCFYIPLPVYILGALRLLLPLLGSEKSESDQKTWNVLYSVYGSQTV